MAGSVLCSPLVNGARMQLPHGCVSIPTEGELVWHYLYRRAVNLPLPCNFISDVNIMRHNPWDIVPIVATERDNGKYFFMRKEIKFRGSHHINRVTGNGFWRLPGKEKPIYYTPGNGSDNLLVGMKRSLTFYYGKGRTAERTKWGMKEFRLAGVGVLPYPVMRCANGDDSKPLCGCAEATIANRNNDLSAVLHCALSLAPMVKRVVQPNESWLICRIYRKRRCAPRVIFPSTIGNARATSTPPANGHAREGHVRSIMGPCLAEGSDESVGSSDEKVNEN
uniref:NAC domain-containing protein n=1 Tax=Leersia perrieri TaxID=77586 RepID=A0A0D9XSD2_9ORYZ